MGIDRIEKGHANSRAIHKMRIGIVIRPESRRICLRSSQLYFKDYDHNIEGNKDFIE
jgi:hypothetical protein